MALTDLFGKKIALLLWFMNEEFEEITVLVSGVAFLHEGELSLHRGHLLPPFPVPLAVVWRAKQVPEDLKDIVEGADYAIQATMAEVEEAA